ncbi:MAG: hypothetical protein ACYTG6_02260 [Planctomycetota bacterium]|jgi:hypothetical protein
MKRLRTLLILTLLLGLPFTSTGCGRRGYVEMGVIFDGYCCDPWCDPYCCGWYCDPYWDPWCDCYWKRLEAEQDGAVDPAREVR